MAQISHEFTEVPRSSCLAEVHLLRSQAGVAKEIRSLILPSFTLG